ncbi:LacI family DNA-binding transcriptional regulator [uncultured Helcococcus sp.]|uniref:LacI family DNA-binding transcriptional regulator n=1 Tax=uncultured Helcococcus sp. TaxID=1072508 RepID=UPI00288C1A6C|nr:LacI family DNA-binding transcriptional regulator [uncultured Helcococcus sp.]
MNSKVTIKDIAYLSGVSISTVSRVVSGKKNVNEITRKKVQDVIKKTGYEPNYTARALATKNTNTIAMVLDRTPKQSFTNSFYIEALEAISHELNLHGKDMLLVFSSNNIKKEDNKVKQLIQTNKIDGVIKLSVHQEDQTLQYLVETSTPTVIIGRHDNKNILSVNNNNVEAMEMAVDELINKGNKKIALVTGNKDLTVTIDRMEGYKKSLLRNNLTFSKDDIYSVNFDIDDAYNIADEIFKKDYDAIATTDDLIAFGISKRAKEVNKIYDILTFNNTLLAELSELPLIIVDINPAEIGKKSVELLLDTAPIEKQVIVNTKII